MTIINNTNGKNDRSSKNGRRNLNHAKFILDKFCEVNELKEEAVLTEVKSAGLSLNATMREPSIFLDVVEEDGGQPVVQLFQMNTDSRNIFLNKHDVKFEVEKAMEVRRALKTEDELMLRRNEVFDFSREKYHLDEPKPPYNNFEVVGTIGLKLTPWKTSIASGSCFFKDPEKSKEVSIETIYRLQKLHKLGRLIDRPIAGYHWILPVKQFTDNYFSLEEFSEAAGREREIIKNFGGGFPSNIEVEDTSTEHFLREIKAEEDFFSDVSVGFGERGVVDNHEIEIKSAYGTTDEHRLSELKFDAFTLTRLVGRYDKEDTVIVILDQYHTEMVNLARALLGCKHISPERISMIAYSSLFSRKFDEDNGRIPKRLHDKPITIYDNKFDVDSELSWPPFSEQTLQLNSSLISGKPELNGSVFKKYVKNIRETCGSYSP